MISSFSNQKGISLVEIVVVTAIFGIISAITIGSMGLGTVRMTQKKDKDSLYQALKLGHHIAWSRDQCVLVSILKSKKITISQFPNCDFNV